MSFDRRKFIKASGLSMIPALLPLTSVGNTKTGRRKEPSGLPVKFFGDGEMFEPGDYVNVLQSIQNKTPILRDRYGAGGAVEALEKRFAAITGKESAVFMPSGTMANQLALAVLSGDNAKVYVQDTSHVYRDEADAAQTVFGKRLMPLAAGDTYFTAAQLKSAIESLPEQEVFRTGVGAVCIESPVRRTDGRMVPLDEIEKISSYCKANKIRLHLDGARLFMASAWSGVSIQKWSSYFDTVYISLYKYLGASAGAVLCGDRAVIGQMHHLMKIHGGSMYGNWTNAAMALHRLEGFEERLRDSIARSKAIFEALNNTGKITFSAFDGGTNIHGMQLSKGIDGKKLQEQLSKEYNIRIPRPNDQNKALISVNETLLYKDASYIIDAFIKSMA